MTPDEIYQAQQAIDAKYCIWHERAHSYERLVHARIERLMQQAGLGSHYHGCVVHNAWVGVVTGKPWANVDSQHCAVPARDHIVKQIHYLDGVTRWRAHRLLEQWFARKQSALRDLCDGQ